MVPTFPLAFKFKKIICWSFFKKFRENHYTGSFTQYFIITFFLMYIFVFFCNENHKQNKILKVWIKFKLFHLVLHLHGIVPTFLKSDSWSPGTGFIYSFYMNNKKWKIWRKKFWLYTHKKIKYIFKKMGANPCWCNSNFKRLFITKVHIRTKVSNPRSSKLSYSLGASIVMCFMKSCYNITILFHIQIFIFFYCY